MINARSETVFDKPAFRKHFKTAVAWYQRTGFTNGTNRQFETADSYRDE